MCLDHEAQMTDPAMQQDMKALLRWEELWRSTLETYSLLALDLPHRQSPEYFISTHTYIVLLFNSLSAWSEQCFDSVVVQIERRPSQTAKVKLFKVSSLGSRPLFHSHFDGPVLFLSD